jgi:hypothetical protein
VAASTHLDTEILSCKPLKARADRLLRPFSVLLAKISLASLRLILSTLAED